MVKIAASLTEMSGNITVIVSQIPSAQANSDPTSALAELTSILRQLEGRYLDEIRTKYFFSQ